MEREDMVPLWFRPAFRIVCSETFHRRDVAMAEKTETYVAVEIGVKEAFDNKYKSTSAKAIKEAFEEAIEKSAILTTKESDKKGGLSLDGNLSLTKTEDGIAGKLSMAMSKDRSIFGTVT